MALEYAPVEEEWASVKDVPLRDHLRNLAGCQLPTSLYISYAQDVSDARNHGPIFEDAFVDGLREMYEFRDSRSIDYVENHPSLRDVLREAHEKIRKYFGTHTRAVLEAVKDSEMDNDERLFLFVQTELPADEVLDRLDEFYEQWWLDRLPRVQPKMSIDVEFV